MKYSVCLLLFAGLFVRCADDETATSAPPPNLTPLSGEAIVLAESGNAFTLNLFQEIYQERSEENIFISPLSVDVALHMTANGAAGSTHTEMKEGLGTAGLSDEEANQAVHDLSAQLTGIDRAVTLSTANSIWFRDQYTLQAGFSELIQTYYDGWIEGLNFDQPNSKDRINGWVENQTRGKIKSLVEEVRGSDVMFLINATYFKANWQYQFDPQQTQEAPFYQEDGTAVSVPMMFSEGVKLRHYYDPSFRLLDIPYGNGQFSLVVLLPEATAGSVASVMDQLTLVNLNQWIAQADTLTPQLYLPEFTTSFKMKLNEPLMRLGMVVPFNSRSADFSKFFQGVDGGLYLDRVIHQSFIEVNEQGTEAAAATVSTISSLSAASIPQPMSVRVDRSFVYLIREKHTQAILFVGTMLNPAESAN